MKSLNILALCALTLWACVPLSYAKGTSCSTVTCPSSKPYCVQDGRHAVCVDNCTRVCPGGWDCSFGEEFNVNCVSPCASARCKAGYKCVPRGAHAKCKAVLSCKHVTCDPYLSCQPVVDCNKTASLCPKACAPCECPEIYIPVCGDDGNTYPNECQATCAHVGVEREGACEDDSGDEPSCICPMIYEPVCGKDGKVYSNYCTAKCAGVSYYPCTNTSGPVCGKDGKTYDTYCHATCSQVKVAGPGACENPSCMCTDEYDPVCGTDGQTYSNECVAKCAGVAVAKDDAC